MKSELSRFFGTKSFWQGVGSVFGLFPIPTIRRIELDRLPSNEQALWCDWMAVGDDMNTAISLFTKEFSQDEQTQKKAAARTREDQYRDDFVTVGHSGQDRGVIPRPDAIAQPS